MKGEARETSPAYHLHRSQDDPVPSGAMGAVAHPVARQDCLSLCPTRTASSCFGVSARPAEFHRAQKWLALARACQRGNAVWHATLAFPVDLGFLSWAG